MVKYIKMCIRDRFVYDKLVEVIGEVITDDMTDYEKEKAIYDWQVKWISYNNDNLNPIKMCIRDRGCTTRFICLMRERLPQKNGKL